MISSFGSNSQEEDTTTLVVPLLVERQSIKALLSSRITICSFQQLHSCSDSLQACRVCDRLLLKSTCPSLRVTTSCSGSRSRGSFPLRHVLFSEAIHMTRLSFVFSHFLELSTKNRFTETTWKPLAFKNSLPFFPLWFPSRFLSSSSAAPVALVALVALAARRSSASSASRWRISPRRPSAKRSC